MSRDLDVGRGDGRRRAGFLTFGALELAPQLGNLAALAQQ